MRYIFVNVFAEKKKKPNTHRTRVAVLCLPKKTLVRCDVATCNSGMVHEVFNPW